MKPSFMSPEHVAAMNHAVAGSPEVTEACRELGKSARVHYRLSGGPGGMVHWTTEITESGLSFGLGEPDTADIVIESDYSGMVRAARAAREGRVDAGSELPVITGDTSLLAAVGGVLALARAVGTIEVEFPDV